MEDIATYDCQPTQTSHNNVNASLVPKKAVSLVQKSQRNANNTLNNSNNSIFAICAGNDNINGNNASNLNPFTSSSCLSESEDIYTCTIDDWAAMLTDDIGCDEMDGDQCAALLCDAFQSEGATSNSSSNSGSSSSSSSSIYRCEQGNNNQRRKPNAMHGMHGLPGIWDDLSWPVISVDDWQAIDSVTNNKITSIDRVAMKLTRSKRHKHNNNSDHCDKADSNDDNDDGKHDNKQNNDSNDSGGDDGDCIDAICNTSKRASKKRTFVSYEESNKNYNCEVTQPKRQQQSISNHNNNNSKEGDVDDEEDYDEYTFGPISNSNHSNHSNSSNSSSQNYWDEYQYQQLITCTSSRAGKFLRDHCVTSAEAVELNLIADFRRLPHKQRHKYGPRVEISKKQREELCKERNRCHAQATRLRRKIFQQISNKLAEYRRNKSRFAAVSNNSSTKRQLLTTSNVDRLATLSAASTKTHTVALNYHSNCNESGNTKATSIVSQAHSGKCYNMNNDNAIACNTGSVAKQSADGAVAGPGPSAGPSAGAGAGPGPRAGAIGGNSCSIPFNNTEIDPENIENELLLIPIDMQIFAVELMRSYAELVNPLLLCSQATHWKPEKLMHCNNDSTNTLQPYEGIFVTLIAPKTVVEGLSREWKAIPNLFRDNNANSHRNNTAATICCCADKKSKLDMDERETNELAQMHQQLVTEGKYLPQVADCFKDCIRQMLRKEMESLHDKSTTSRAVDNNWVTCFIDQLSLSAQMDSTVVEAETERAASSSSRYHVNIPNQPQYPVPWLSCCNSICYQNCRDGLSGRCNCEGHLSRVLLATTFLRISFNDEATNNKTKFGMQSYSVPTVYLYQVFPAAENHDVLGKQQSPSLDALVLNTDQTQSEFHLHIVFDVISMKDIFQAIARRYCEE